MPARTPIMGVYAIRNTVTGRCYVGSSIDIAVRWREHRRVLRKGQSGCTRLQAAWNKHGEPSFVLEVLEQVADRTTLIDREQFWIDQLRTFSRGYNAKPKAVGAPPDTEATRAAKSKATSEVWRKRREAGTAKHSPEVVQANSERGRSQWAYLDKTEREEKMAQLRTPEAKAKNAASNRGKQRTPSHRAAVSAALTGRTRSPETRARMSAAQRKANTPERSAARGALNRERGWSQASREKVSASLKSAWQDGKYAQRRSPDPAPMTDERRKKVSDGLRRAWAEGRFVRHKAKVDKP